MKYYIVIPAHNEEGFLAKTLESVIGQSHPPGKVVVVNDHSNDATEAVIDRYVSVYPYIFKLNTTSSSIHMPGSKVVNAFKAGLAALDDSFDFIVKLDADVVLPQDYFEKISMSFASDENIGIAGGFIYERNENGEWELNHTMDKTHVRGAFKAYSKACFQAIGGLKSAMGWDTLDELLAAYHGFTTYTNPELKVKHLRPTGKAYDRRARYLQGTAMYRMRYGFWITLIASAKMAITQKRASIFSDCIKGFVNAWKSSTPFLVNRQEGHFIRDFRWRNIRRKLFQGS